MTDSDVLLAKGIVLSLLTMYSFTEDEDFPSSVKLDIVKRLKTIPLASKTSESVAHGLLPGLSSSSSVKLDIVKRLKTAHGLLSGLS